VKPVLPRNYAELLTEIKQRIRSAQYEALKAVNHEHISLYWDIGKMIVVRQKGDSWGKSIVERLAADLQKEFPGVAGFSARNIWHMRNFFVTYSRNSILQPLVAEIGWTHNLVILEQCKDDSEREFYIRMTKKFGWSKNVLIHQIENQSYRKYLLNQTNFDKAVPEKYRNQAKLAVKDEYTFDFLELGEEHDERELERAIMLRIEKFLVEMGGRFAFMGRQYRLEVDKDEFFIDLLLYHRHLRSLVAVELKVGKFVPEFVGKMQFYLSVLDDKVRLADESPSIGIILCKSKKRVVVEYALREATKPIGVAIYKVVKQLPSKLRAELPAPEQIRELMEGVQ
jgi:predicted nuclease of restriction endonuclease-like (RecB) superfamily